MNMKIIMFVLFTGLLINPVMCEIFEDSFIHTGSSTDDYGIGYTGDSTYTDYKFDSVSVNNIVTLKDMKLLSYTVDGNKFTGLRDSEYNGVTLTVGGNPIGTGIFGYSYNPDKTTAYVHLFITSDELDIGSLSGVQEIVMSGNNINVRVLGTGTKTAYCTSHSSDARYAFFEYQYPDKYIASQTTDLYNIQTGYIHIFNFNYSNDYNINRIQMIRNATLQSKVLINNNGYELYNESSLKTTNLDFINNTYDIWYISNENIYGNIETKTLIFDIPSYQPILTTDKTYYNTSEIIEISFTDIDFLYNECTEYICEKPYELHILYPISDPYKQYGTKFIYPLTYNLEDEIIYLNTSFLHPENNYILGIVGINGDYHKHDDILLFSDSFTVYPDDEYLSVSCDSETSCYTYNNADITIYYQINNNSDIIIKDNDNNIINTYHNIIGNGEILYHIPDDLYHENTYPNWKIYLNNTGYSTSFNKGVIVYWSQFQTPTPTPTYISKPTPDINISDTIDEFKTETQPIKDLIFGLSEIVIDNPDYNKDNIVDENEINHWFNSLIPLCIIFLLIVLYIGLKKNRND